MSTRPLDGLTVVEIGHSVAAPFAGLIFGALGADVIKVENPEGGDHARGWGPPFWGDTATAYLPLNREKRGVVLDLAEPAAVDSLKRLIREKADVVVQNLRSGTVDRYGLDAETLRREKPELIYCNIGAFGDRGPLKNKPGYDPLMQAFAGIMSVTGEYERPPVRAGVSIVDMGSGMWAVIGALAALLERQRTGKGAAINTSLFETATAWMMVHMAAFQASGEVRKPFGSGLAEIVPYQAFLTADGWLMVAAGNDGLFRKLCATIGRPELASDPRFHRNADRVVNRTALIPILEDVFRGRRRAEWTEALDKANIPNAPINTVADVTRHPQFEAVGMLQKGPAGSLPTIGVPLTFDGERPTSGRAAPALGEHTEDVFGRRRG
jgi:crotonobetainyl-CoA:carnitine CoA-transferase CaiB-like acyl-CoA transferase